MAISIRHPFVAQIDDRAKYLEDLTREYPSFLHRWESLEEKEFSKIADDNANGDDEVRQSIYNQLLTSLEDDEYRKNIFYQALLIMCFSYYESSISFLCKKIGAKDTIKSICRAKNITLSDKVQEKVNYINECIKPLRNNLCHNNFGTFRNFEVLTRLAQEKKGLYFDREILTITNSDFIIEVIDCMHNILKELCEQLGFKTKILR